MSVIILNPLLRGYKNIEFRGETGINAIDTLYKLFTSEEENPYSVENMIDMPRTEKEIYEIYFALKPDEARKHLLQRNLRRKEKGLFERICDNLAQEHSDILRDEAAKKVIDFANYGETNLKH